MCPFLIIFYCSFSIISFILTCVQVPLAEKEPYPMMHQQPCLIGGLVFFHLNVLHFFSCLMKTTPWWSKVSFWCHGHQTTEEEAENLFRVFLLLLLVPKTLSFNLTSLSRHALANTNYILMCLGGHTVRESPLVASMEESLEEHPLHAQLDTLLPKWVMFIKVTLTVIQLLLLASHISFQQVCQTQNFWLPIKSLEFFLHS